MENLSRGRSIWNSWVNEYLVHIQKYCEEFISPSKHHTQGTESCVRDIETWSATGISGENASTLVVIFSIVIAPINRDILENVEGRNRKVNMHMTSVFSDNRQNLYNQSKRRATSCAEKYPPIFHPTSDKGKLLISFSSNNTPTVHNMERG